MLLKYKMFALGLSVFLFTGCLKNYQYTLDDCKKMNKYPEIFPDGSILCLDDQKLARENSHKHFEYRNSNDYKAYLIRVENYKRCTYNIFFDGCVTGIFANPFQAINNYKQTRALVNQIQHTKNMRWGRTPAIPENINFGPINSKFNYYNFNNNSNLSYPSSYLSFNPYTNSFSSSGPLKNNFLSRNKTDTNLNAFSSINYIGSSGRPYSYDLTNIYDRQMYSNDVSSQINDMMPGGYVDRFFDNSMGQFGGGMK